MERVSRVIRQVEPHDSVERYEALGVECIAGTAKITSPWTVEVETASGRRTLTTKSIAIAAGARPFVPPIPGLDQVGYLTSDTVWNLRELPRRIDRARRRPDWVRADAGVCPARQSGNAN